MPGPRDSSSRAGDGSNVTAIVYDLDGTLIDSAGSIAAAVNRIRGRFGLAGLTTETVVASVGDGAVRLIERLVYGRGLGARPAPEQVLDFCAHPFDGVYEAFLEGYHADPTAGITFYDGVRDALQHWLDRGVPQAVLTNKPDGPTQLVVEKLGLRQFFASVVGAGAVLSGREVPPKPDPAALELVIQGLGADPAGVWMVGDGPQDVRVAQNAGIRSIAIESGYNDAGELRVLRPPPTHLVPSFRDAFEILKGAC